MQGTLYITNVSKFKKLDASIEKWLITRGGKDIPGTFRAKGLSPSWELFTRYLKEWKGKPPELWWEEYKQIFLAQLEEKNSQIILQKIANQIKQGKNIALICYCPDARYCHRILIALYLQEHYGIQFVEI